MSERLGIEIDLELNDELAQSQMKSALKSLKELANNKANNVDIKINVNKNGLADLEKVEKAVKEINKLSIDAQKGLFKGSGSVLGINKDSAKVTKEYWQQYRDEARKTEVMYGKMFDTLGKEELKTKSKYANLFDQAELNRVKARNKARNDEIESQVKAEENLAKSYSKLFEQAEVNNAKAKAKAREQQLAEEERFQEQYRNLFDQAELKNQKSRIDTYNKEQQEKEKINQKALSDEEKKYRDYEKLFEQAIIKESKMKATQRENEEKERKAQLDKETKERQQSEERRIKQDNEIMMASYKQQLAEKQKLEKEQINAQKRLREEQEKTFSSINKDVDKAQQQIEKLFKSDYTDKGALSSLKNDLEEIANIHAWEGIENLNKIDLSHSRNEVDKVLDSLEKIENTRLESIKADNLSNFSTKMTRELDKIEAELRELGQSTEIVDQFRRELNNLDSVSLDRLPSEMKRFTNEVSHLKSEVKNVKSETSGMKNFFGDLYDSMRTFTLGNIIGNGIEDGVRAIKTTILELDGAMTDMMKVAPESFKGTSDELKQIGREASEVAKQVGQSTTDVIQGTAKALQTGAESMKDAMEIAKGSSMFANVGDITQEQADTYIASVLSAYGGITNALKPVREQVQGMGNDYNQLTKFLDLANYSGNNFASSTADVGEALMRSGAVLSEYGVSMQDAVALIVGANESIQDAGKVGTSLKTLSINMAGMKTSAKEGTLELNKTAKSMKEIANIDVYSNKSKGEVKDMMTLLTELQGKWGDLRQDQQLALSEAVAGEINF